MKNTKIIKGQCKNNGEYKIEDKYTPILNNGIVIGFIESVDEENINIVLWDKYISKEYLYGESKNILYSLSLGCVI